MMMLMIAMYMLCVILYFRLLWETLKLPRKTNQILTGPCIFRRHHLLGSKLYANEMDGVRGKWPCRPGIVSGASPAN
jgi:hypothetical protein